jgi:uncharacterized protein YaaW (UPF0174 family)
MKNKYSQYGSYIDIGSYYSDCKTYGEYSNEMYLDMVNYIYKNVYESKEDKLERLAREKAQKRNDRIDQILG